MTGHRVPASSTFEVFNPPALPIVKGKAHIVLDAGEADTDSSSFAALPPMVPIR